MTLPGPDDRALRAAPRHGLPRPLARRRLQRLAITLAATALALACATSGGQRTGGRTPGPVPEAPAAPVPPPPPAPADEGTERTRSAAAAAARIPRVERPVEGDPTVAIQLRFATGSADDPPGREGLTLLCATLMAEGGTEALDAARLRRALYPMAADLGVVAGKEAVTFTGRVPAVALERFLPLLLDVVLHPRLDPGQLERLRARALDEVARTLRGEDDERLGKEALSLALYDGHPYGHPDVGTVEGLSRIGLEDVERHRAQVFARSRLTIGVAGAVPPGLADRLAQALAALPEGAPPRPLPPPADRAPRFTLVEKPSAPTAISLGLTWDVRRGHPDFPALVLAVAALGQHRQGAAFRLFRSLRELRGLNYGDYAYAEHFVEEEGGALPEPGHPRSQQALTVWLRPVEPQHRAFALRLALFEVERWAREGLGEEELARAKRFLAGHTLAFDATSARRLGNALDDRFHGLGRPWYEELRARLPGLTREEVNAALRRHVDPARLRVAVATHGAESLAEELRSGAPSPMAYASRKPPEVLAEDAVVARFPFGVRNADDVRVVPVEELFQR